MRIDLIFPAYPPYPHAIGQYVSLLAAALREEGVDARVICSQEQSVAGAVLKAPVSEEFIDGIPEDATLETSPGAARPSDGYAAGYDAAASFEPSLRKEV